MLQENVTCSVSLKGEDTETNFDGVFTLKVKLTHRDMLRQDEIYRNCLGTSPGNAGTLAANIAEAISYLGVRVSKAPSWWTDSNGGMDLQDSNVLSSVYLKAYEAIENEYKRHRKTAEEAAPALKVAASAIDAAPPV